MVLGGNYTLRIIALESTSQKNKVISSYLWIIFLKGTVHSLPAASLLFYLIHQNNASQKKRVSIEDPAKQVTSQSSF